MTDYFKSNSGLKFAFNECFECRETSMHQLIVYEPEDCLAMFLCPHCFSVTIRLNDFKKEEEKMNQYVYSHCRHCDSWGYNRLVESSIRVYIICQKCFVLSML